MNNIWLQRDLYGSDAENVEEDELSIIDNASSSGDSTDQSSDLDDDMDDSLYSDMDDSEDDNVAAEEGDERPVCPISDVLEGELSILMRRGRSEASRHEGVPSYRDVETIRRGFIRSGGVANPRNLMVGVLYYMLPLMEPFNYLDSWADDTEIMFREMVALELNIDSINVRTEERSNNNTTRFEYMRIPQWENIADGQLSDSSIDSDEPLDYSVRRNYF